MSSSLETTIIADHALEKKENLVTALKVAAAADEISSRIIRGFLEKLEKSLLGQLGDDWRIVNELQNKPLEKWQMFGFTKTAWPKRYQIVTMPARNGARDFFMGIRKPDKDAGVTPLDMDLKDVLDRGIRPGQQSEWWSYWSWLENPYRQWDGVDVLVDLFFGDDAVEWFSLRLLRIRELTEGVFDSHFSNVVNPQSAP
jgi:hypothetical protein